MGSSKQIGRWKQKRSDVRRKRSDGSGEKWKIVMKDKI